jgi:hypothetical protein
LPVSFPLDNNTNPKQVETCSGTRGVGVAFPQIFKVEVLLPGYLRLLEVDHLDIQGFQVDYGEDSWLGN